MAVPQTPGTLREPGPSSRLIDHHEELVEFAEGVRLSISDVELCLTNGKRLTRDARRVSSETRLALLELALEELAKGEMIFFRLLLQEAARRSVSVDTDAPDLPEEARALEILRSRIGLLSDEAIRRAFWDHDIKLEFVALLVNLTEVVINPAMFSRVDLRALPLRTRFVGWFILHGWGRRLAMTQFVQAIEYLRSLGIERLDDVGKRSVYVDLERNASRTIPPTAARDTIGALDVLVGGLTIGLTFQIDEKRREMEVTRPVGTPGGEPRPR